MADWAEGYVSEIGYTYGYYGELNPTRAAIHFLKAGLAVPKFGVACELGFGQGMSINAHAASSAVKWYGTDFNPAQAGFAQELSEVAESNAELFDQSFEEFCTRDDLPKFDFIGLHGIWSWISDSNRQIIVDFIRRKLKVGGVVYISYNTLPGWAAAGPLRHILAEHRHVMTPQGMSIADQVGESIDFVKSLVGLSTSYTERVPFITKRMEEIGNQNRNYLAHEYFNRDWQPMYFSQLQDWLSPAKVSFACSASFVDDFDLVQLNDEQRVFLEKIPDRDLQQTVRDYLLLRQFRRDYWVKGYRKINKMQQMQAWREIRVMLVKPREDISLQIAGAAQTATLKDEFYLPIFDALASHEACKVSDLERTLSDKNIDLELIIEAVTLLNSRGDLAIVQDEKTQKEVKKRTLRLNKHLMQMAIAKGDVDYLTSPVTGSALPVPRFHQIFLFSILQGKEKSEEWVRDGWSALELQNRVLLKDGKKLESKEDNLKELGEMADNFKTKWLPLYKALHLI